MQSEPQGAARRVAGGPRFARSSVRCVPVSAQRPAVDKGVRQGIYDILARSAKQARNDGGRGNTYEEDMIQADPVKAVLKRKHTLNFVGLDHAEQQIAHRDRPLTVADSLPRQVVRNRKETADVVRRVAPLSREPG